jgi:hypothetical protein
VDLKYTVVDQKGWERGGDQTMQGSSQWESLATLKGL